MIAMFGVYVGGWVIVYVLGTINWNDAVYSQTVQQALSLLPTISVLINTIHLYLYNPDMRKYLKHTIQNISSFRSIINTN